MVFNAIIISTAALILLVALFWWLLYFAQNTSEIVYRLTRVIPVPVAQVDGENVRYSDYLMKYRSSIHYLVEKERLNLSTEDGKRQADRVKNVSMEDAIADAYARKLAKEQNITVSNEELESFLIKQRASPDGEVSEATYDAVILDYYGWSHDEYREAMKAKLLRQKVAFVVDTDAKAKADTISERIKSGTTDLAVLASDLAKSSVPNIIYIPASSLPKTNRDGGLTSAAAGLQNGQVSEAIRTTNGDGYYFVRVLESSATNVTYETLQVPLDTFTKRLEAVRANDKTVSKYIDIPELTTPATQ